MPIVWITVFEVVFRSIGTPMVELSAIAAHSLNVSRYVDSHPKSC